MLSQEAFFKTVGYKPHPRQDLYHQSKARFTVPVCGRRFGKSTMAGRKLEPHLFQPDRVFWIVGPTYDLGEKEFRVVWNDIIIKQGLGKDKRIKKAYNKNQGMMYIEFTPWRTRLEVRTADQPENLVGEALDGVIMSEAAKHKEETFQRYIRPALGDRRGWATFPTTPEGQNWLYDLWLLGQDPNFPDYESWQFPSWDNHYLYPEGRTDSEIILQEKTMSREAFAQEIGADFTTFVGKIYPEFDMATHVIDDYVFKPEWPNYLFFDFGYVNPFCALDVQIDPWDNVYIWREHYLSYERIDAHLALMARREQPFGYHVDMATGDAADPASCEHISEKLVGCFYDPKSKENWREGVDLVKTFLEVRELSQLVVDEEGNIVSDEVTAPRLFVSRDCKNTIREFNNYKSPETTGSFRNRKSPRETAQTIDDHALDALRYGLMHLYKLGARYHLQDTMGIMNVPVIGSKGETVAVNSRTFTSPSDNDFNVDEFLDLSWDQGIFSMEMDFS